MAIASHQRDADSLSRFPETGGRSFVWELVCELRHDTGPLLWWLRETCDEQY